MLIFAHSASHIVGAGPAPPITPSCSTLSHRTRSKDSNRCHAACLLISVDNGRKACPQKLWLLVLKVELTENSCLQSLGAHDASQKSGARIFNPITMLDIFQLITLCDDAKKSAKTIATNLGKHWSTYCKLLPQQPSTSRCDMNCWLPQYQ